MKMVPRAAIIGGVLIAVGTVGLGLELARGNGIQADRVYTGSMDETKTFHASAVSTVHLNVDAGRVHVLRGSGADIKVHVYGEASLPGVGDNLYFDADTSGSDLRITVKHPWADRSILDLPWSENWNESRLNVDVEIPKGTYDNVDVDVKAGELDIEDIATKQVNVDMDAGNIRLSNVHSKLTASTNAGDMDIQNVTGAMDLKTEAGKIDVAEERIQDDITAQTKAGSIKVNVKTAPDNLQFRLNTELGKAEINLPNVKTTRNDTAGIEGSIGTDGPRVELRSGLGDVSLQCIKNLD